MQSPCYRCGANVEDGSAFCPECSAPQIRVAAPQAPANEPFTRSQPPPAPDLVPPEALPMSFNQTGTIQWKGYRRIALPLSLIAGAGISLIPPIGLLFFVACTVFAVGHYGRDHQGPLKASQGAKMGAFNGLISYVAATALGVAFNHANYRQQMMLTLQKQFSGNTDPQVQQILHWVGTNQGFVIFTALALLFGLAVFLIVSSFIGAITVSFAGNRDRR